MTKENSRRKIKIAPLLESAFLISCTLLAFTLIGVTIAKSEGTDFDVFYYSARQALQGQTIYDTYGPVNLPYWYFPWLAWFYLPLAFFSREIAYSIYITISILCAAISINFLCQKMAPHTTVFERLLMLSMALTMCWLLFKVGQMDFILLAIAVLMMHYIDTQRSSLAGLLTPIILLKPHLFILFLIYLALKGGKFFILSAMSTMSILVATSFIIVPSWPLQMLELLQKSGQRTDHASFNFTTLPNLLGSQENWSGTANLPFTILLILAGFLIIWKFRSLEPFPLLALSLAGSLFCAPRAYAYNFTLLIPSMVWLSADLSRRFLILFWAAVGISSILLGYSTEAYLIVLTIFIAGIYKATLQLQDAELSKPFQ